MATTGLYKMGDGSNYATNCFPARSILCTRSGRWVPARRATPRAWTGKGTTGKGPQQRRKPPESASEEENNEDNVLDEPFLMKHHCSKNPSDLCSVNISSQNLVSAKEDDFGKFDCVAFINAAENLLTLAILEVSRAAELELSLNGLRNLKITAGDFLHLEDLDLSYNNLSPQAIWTLGDLSQLKVLRLTANGLRSLPLDLAGSWDSAHLRFPSLEVLLLDDNHLSDPSVFVSLSHLRSLRELNLDKNRISAVPYLHQAESGWFFLRPALDGDGFRAEWYKALSSLWQESQAPQQEGTEVPAELEVKKGQLQYVVLQNNRDPGRTEVVLDSGSQEHPGLVVPREGESSILKTLPAPSMRQDGSAPCPELKRLSLAFNKIADEAALLPVAFFPCLKELTFHNNPLTTTRSGTVTSHLPEVTKRPLMLEAPAKTFLWRPLPAVVEAVRDAASPSLAQPLPPVSSLTAASSRWTALGEGEGDSRPPPGSAKDIASFFMTQVKLGWIQKNVQALHNILQHPLVYRDAKPRLDSVQKPYVPRKKRGRMPGPPAHKTRAEVLEGILRTMRNTSTITEVPQASVLQKRKSSPKTYWEAWRPMEEFQEVFEIPPETVTMGEEVAKPSFGAQVVEALLKEATSEQGSPQQQLLGKKAAEKVTKV